jgi:hypothetical protein
LGLKTDQHSDLWRSWGRKQIEGRRIQAANRQAEKEKKLRDKEDARVEAFVFGPRDIVLLLTRIKQNRRKTHRARMVGRAVDERR